MCGIAGYYKNQSNLDLQIDDIFNTIKHRGPDGRGFFEDDHIVLVHTRLSIVDIEFGHQPYIFENYVIVFNGEIYNHNDLRRYLIKAGFSFDTKSDTEVLLKAYIHYGKDCLDYINGMYAFVIYNKEDKEIVFSRDHFGIKPLYFYHDKDCFYFSSEAKSLIFMLNRAGIDCSIKANSQIEYLKEGCIIKSQIIENFKEVNQGTLFKYDKSSISKMHDMNFENVVIEDKSLEELLKLELEEELLADVEVGVLLSGGIDSSLITAISAKLRKNIKTFSISFENKKLYDESKYSQVVAKSFNTDHYEFLFSEDELLNYLPQLIESTDLPIYDPAMLPMLYLMDNVSDICKVVISGDGGDEIFAGYTHHRVLKYRRIFTIISKFLSIFNIFSNKNNTLKSLLKLSPNLKDCIEYNQKVSLNHRLLRKTDLCSMRNGVEVRVPFLSNRIYKYSKKFNPKEFINIMYGKLPLRKLVKKHINSEIAFKKKQGFRVPIKEWVSEGELGKIIEQDLNNELYIDRKVISINSIQNFLNNKEKFYDELFSLYILNNWLKEIHRLQ